jgi:hypothetical protein
MKRLIVAWANICTTHSWVLIPSQKRTKVAVMSDSYSFFRLSTKFWMKGNSSEETAQKWTYYEIPSNLWWRHAIPRIWTTIWRKNCASRFEAKKAVNGIAPSVLDRGAHEEMELISKCHFEKLSVWSQKKNTMSRKVEGIWYYCYFSSCSSQKQVAEATNCF